MHRYWHSPSVYPRKHKLHHSAKYPNAFSTGVMGYEETFLSIAVPRFISPLLVSRLIGPYDLTQFLLYQLFVVGIELIGHSGHVSDESNLTFRFGTSAIILSLGVNLEVGHHDLHHEKFNVNFGKRMCIMDKMFGTYLDWREKIPKGTTISKAPGEMKRC